MASNITVRYLTAAEYADWDDLVTQSVQGTLFHKSYWLGASGEQFRIYGCFKGEKLLAGLAIACGASRLGFKTGLHPLLTPYLGVVFRKSEAKRVKRISDEKNISQAIAEKMKEDFGSIMFNFAPFPADLQPFIWAEFSSGVRYTYLLELDDLDDVWKGMDESRRRNIRRAEKDGIRVESGGSFDQTFALVDKTFRRQEKDAFFRSAAYRYNEALSQRGQCNSFLARNKDGKAIAAVYIVWDEKRSYYILGGYDVEERHHGASAMAMWEAIKFTRNELALCQFDFEGSMIPQIEQFFRKFGGELTPYYSVHWVKPSVKAALYTRRLLERGLRKLRFK